ncbi:hypothetical protein BGX38DRAFT_381210 [Terfezia claveryi]|nr:hypothetical protein BGX38DRAFT_381210 [Terfezia claveryi]
MYFRELLKCKVSATIVERICLCRSRKINLIVQYLILQCFLLSFVLHAFFVHSYSLSAITVVCYCCLCSNHYRSLLLRGLFKPLKSTVYIRGGQLLFQLS